MGRLRFLTLVARRGTAALRSLHGAALGVLGLLAVAGLAVQEHIATSVPVWVKALALAAILTSIMFEGSYRAFTDKTGSIAHDPTNTQTVSHFYGGYHVHTHNSSGSQPDRGVEPPVESDGSHPEPQGD